MCAFSKPAGADVAEAAPRWPAGLSFCERLFTRLLAFLRVEMTCTQVVPKSCHLAAPEHTYTIQPFELRLKMKREQNYWHNLTEFDE